MKIPHTKKEKINKVQYAIASNLITQKLKRHIFYTLISDLLEWCTEDIKKYDIEEDEIQSEFFLISCSLLGRFDQTKSSLIPFLEKQIDWELSKLFIKLKKEVILVEQKEKEYEYQNPDEIYLMNPELFIFENKYLGKIFTQSEKYIISEVLLDESLNHLNLSERFLIDRRTVKNKIDTIKNKLEENHYGKTNEVFNK